MFVPPARAQQQGCWDLVRGLTFVRTLKGRLGEEEEKIHTGGPRRFQFGTDFPFVSRVYISSSSPQSERILWNRDFWRKGLSSP
jgi:hypothetical protein